MVGDPPEEEVAAATDAADGGEGEGADEPAAVASGEPASDGVAAEEDDGAKVEDDDGGDDDGGDDDEGEAPPQPQAREGGAAYLRKSTNESEGELVDCCLTPDFMGQKQNLKDALQGDPAVPPPLAEGGGDGGGGGEPQSALHRDEYAKYEIEGGHDPRHHESALNSDPSPGSSAPEGNASSSSALSGLNPFKSRRKPRLVAGKGGAKGHSHPRKSPYKSEVARLRHAQQLEREKRDFSKDPPDDGTAGSSASKGPSIKDTTAPPDTAFFSIQSAKFKHNLLHSLGEFLTSAFADDEEASGSYFGDDLLEQLESNDPRLKGVWLQAKNLDDEHVRRLCEALLRNKVVAEVWLPSNRITDVGASHVAHMLKFNRSIRELFLGDNDIGPRGASALAGALARNNSTLVALGLGDNRIGVEGAGAFAAALRHNHTLHTLDVKNNGIPRRSSIRGLLAKMLEFNASDPGDESLVMGLQEELAGLVASLPPDAAERAVVQAEEALKRAMLCRRRGDRIGAAEAEGAFIRICTTGEPPVDPPEETEGGEGGGGGRRAGDGDGGETKASRRGRGRPRPREPPTDPDDGPEEAAAAARDGLEAELSGLTFREGPAEDGAEGCGDDKEEEAGVDGPPGEDALGEGTDVAEGGGAAADGEEGAVAAEGGEEGEEKEEEEPAPTACEASAPPSDADEAK